MVPCRDVHLGVSSSDNAPLYAGDAGDPAQLGEQALQHQHYASQAQLAAGGWDHNGIPWDPSAAANQVHETPRTPSMSLPRRRCHVIRPANLAGIRWLSMTSCGDFHIGQHCQRPDVHVAHAQFTVTCMRSHTCASAKARQHGLVGCDQRPQCVPYRTVSPDTGAGLNLISDIYETHYILVDFCDRNKLHFYLYYNSRCCRSSMWATWSLTWT